MRYKLICADIDGTLLNDRKQLLPKVRESLQEAVRRGARVALVSGRMPGGLDLIETELGIECVKVCNAGTYILLGEQCISSVCMLPDIMKRVYMEIARERKLPLWIFQERKWFVTDIDEYIEREIEIIRYQPDIVDAAELADRWSREGTGPNKLLIAAKPAEIRDICREIKTGWWPGISTALSADVFLEIFPEGVTKGTALMKICDRLNIDAADTIAFGDHELDIPMIEAAGLGVAMGNAIEELKEKADYVTKSNNEAGIAWALQKYLVG